MIDDEDPTMPEDEGPMPKDNEVVPEEDYCEDVFKSADTRDIDEVHHGPEAVCYQHQGYV